MPALLDLVLPVRALYNTCISDAHQFVALLAQDVVDGTLSSGLPDNQWQLEAARWFQTSLAKLQGLVVQYPRSDVSKYGGLGELRGPSFYPL